MARVIGTGGGEYPGQKMVVALPGQWIFPCVRVSAHQRFSIGSRILSLRFRCVWPGGVPLFQPGQTLVMASRAHPQLEVHAREVIARVASEFPDLASQQSAPCAPLTHFLQVNSAFYAWLNAWTQTLLLLGHTPTSPARRDPRVQAALTWLEAQAGQAAFDRAGSARRVGVSPSQLDRLFVQNVGCTPRAYYDDQRLMFARHRLNATPEPIKTISYQLGFKRVSHFSAWFSRCTGSSPRSFRRHRTGAI